MRLGLNLGYWGPNAADDVAVAQLAAAAQREAPELMAEVVL